MGLILQGTAVAVFTCLVEKAAVLVGAGLAAKEGRAVFRGAELRSQNSITVDGSVDGLYTQSCIFFAGVGHVNAYALVGSPRFCFADDNLVDVTILTEVVGAT